MAKKFEVIAVTATGEEIKDTITASNEDKARELFLKTTPAADSIDEVNLLIDYDKVQAEKYFKRFRDKIGMMRIENFQEFDNMMFRTFNFLLAVEELDIPEIRQLQEEPRDNNISVTSWEFLRKCDELINIDIR